MLLCNLKYQHITKPQRFLLFVCRHSRCQITGRRNPSATPASFVSSCAHFCSWFEGGAMFIYAWEQAIWEKSHSRTAEMWQTCLMKTIQEKYSVKKKLNEHKNPEKQGEGGCYPDPHQYYRKLISLHTNQCGGDKDHRCKKLVSLLKLSTKMHLLQRGRSKLNIRWQICPIKNVNQTLEANIIFWHTQAQSVKSKQLSKAGFKYSFSYWKIKCLTTTTNKIPDKQKETQEELFIQPAVSSLTHSG